MRNLKRPWTERKRPTLNIQPPRGRLRRRRPWSTHVTMTRPSPSLITCLTTQGTSTAATVLLHVSVVTLVLFYCVILLKLNRVVKRVHHSSTFSCAALHSVFTPFDEETNALIIVLWRLFRPKTILLICFGVAQKVVFDNFLLKPFITCMFELHSIHWKTLVFYFFK